MSLTSVQADLPSAKQLTADIGEDLPCACHGGTGLDGAQARVSARQDVC